MHVDRTFTKDHLTGILQIWKKFRHASYFPSYLKTSLSKYLFADIRLICSCWVTYYAYQSQGLYLGASSSDSTLEVVILHGLLRTSSMHWFTSALLWKIPIDIWYLLEIYIRINNQTFSYLIFRFKNFRFKNVCKPITITETIYSFQKK